MYTCSDRGFTGLLPMHRFLAVIDFSGFLMGQFVLAVIEVSLVYFQCTARPRSDKGFTGLLPVQSVPAVIEDSLVYFRCTVPPQ